MVCLLEKVKSEVLPPNTRRSGVLCKVYGGRTAKGGHVDVGLEFEQWLRYSVPGHLKLSGSKCVAMEKVFQQFANEVRVLVDKFPNEFGQFFNELKTRVESVEKWRAPKGYIVVPAFAFNDDDTINKGASYSNGRTRWRLYKKDGK